jgi:hypothetical protein
MPPELTQNMYTGVLEPLAPYADQLTMIRGIATHADAPGPGHDAGSHAYCCAWSTKDGDNANKQGPSLDWVAKETLAPKTSFETVSAGVFSGKQGGKKVRWVHSWRGASQPNEPFTNPQKLFESLFGTAGNMMMQPGMQPDAVQTMLAEQRHKERKSVLDAVHAEYTALTSPASGYPASSKALINDHFELLRALETRVGNLSVTGQTEGCTLPPQTLNQDIDAVEGMLGGYKAHWEKIWPLMVDIYVAGLRCDLFRFGNVLVTNGGDEFSHRIGDSFAEDIHGDWFHKYPSEKANVDAIIKWEWEQLSYFLKQLSDPAFKEANGKTLLENSTVFLGTELGALPHVHEDLTFFIAGAQGRFKRGVHEMGNRSDVDMYQTILTSLGVPTKFGDPTFSTGDLPILA